jgi:triphosphatase
MEIEFKFCIPPERLAAVQAAARRGTHAHIRMEARYFDTPEAALSSRGIAFRLRREGDQWVQTVKALGNGPLDREEHNVDRGHATGPAPEPQPELHAGTVAGTRLLGALQAASGPLTETYGTEMDRVTRDIAFKGGVVELALDIGRVIAHRGTPQQKEARICELELELKAGPLAGLAAIATRWATRHRLFLSTVSKAGQWPAKALPERARVAARGSGPLPPPDPGQRQRDRRRRGR